MADAKRSDTDALIGRALITTDVLAGNMREQISRAIDSPVLASSDLLANATRIIESFQRQLENALVEADLSARVIGTQAVLADVPAPVTETLESPPGGGGPTGGIITTAGEDPLISLPLIEDAAKNLVSRNIVNRAEFDRLAVNARERAFTVARQSRVETIERIRDLLQQAIVQGQPFSEFRRQLEESLVTSPLGAGHLETVFRTNIQTAFHEAHDRLASNPIVAEVFPYQQYFAVRDGRARPEHLALEELGLSGTNIFRRDDPFWQVFTPPWGFSCRCSINLMTLEAAARAGVQEARRWERTGQPPSRPEFRLDSIPFRPDPAFRR